MKRLKARERERCWHVSMSLLTHRIPSIRAHQIWAHGCHGSRQTPAMSDTHTHTHIHTHARTHAHTHTHNCMHARTQPHTIGARALIIFIHVIISGVFSSITPVFSVTWSFRNHSNVENVYFGVNYLFTDDITTTFALLHFYIFESEIGKPD